VGRVSTRRSGLPTPGDSSARSCVVRNFCVATYVEADMRTLTTITVVALVTFALFAAPGSAATHPHHHHPCAIPRGWKLVARDSYAVVIRQRNVQQPAYEFCSRLAGFSGAGRFRRVANTLFTESWPVVALQLRGHYIAYETEATTSPGYALWLADTRTGVHVYTYTINPTLPPPPVFVLSPNGVTAWIVYSSSPVKNAPGQTMLQALTGAGSTVLDSDPALANLALYDCAASCPSNTTIVAWTNNGQQRYAEVSS
jgi:hypothetical protein